MVNFTHIAVLFLVEACKFCQNCIYVPPNTRSIPIINNLLDRTTVFPFEVDHKALNTSRDWDSAIPCN